MENLASSSFGEMLKTLRRRQRLTQLQLATELGIHRNTIGFWERGDFLPDTKGMVLELARHLNLSDAETRQLLEASLTGLSPAWNVPYVRNPFFTGREEILEELHKYLTGEAVVALTQSYALSGLGGIGKTQLAVEYTYRYGLSYSAIWWIEAESAETTLSSFVAIAEHLQLPERQEKDQQKIVAAVQRWLSTHSQWLLVWDNVEDLTRLQRFLPATRAGAVLLTTRRQTLATLAQSMEVPSMTSEEGLLLLLRRAGILRAQATPREMGHLARQKPEEYRAAAELVRVMDGLPLALDQAGAYIQETQCGPSNYLQLFETRQTDLLSRRGEGAKEHPASVSATWSLSFARVEQQNPVAAELLRCCAFLHPDAIPEELFTQGTGQLSPQLQLLERDPLAFDEAVRVLLSYSLIHRDRSTATLSLHRLVQAVLLDTQPLEERKQWQGRVIQALAAVFPERTLDGLEVGVRFLPHALITVPWIENETQPTPVEAHLLERAGDYLRTRGQYTEARPLLELSLALREELLGATHPDTATSLHSLGVLHEFLGKYELAEPLYQRALSIRKQQLGEMHPDTAACLHSLGNLYLYQGKYELAEPLYQRALSIHKEQLGATHPKTAASLNNLALLYWYQGKYEQAESLNKEVLALKERELGATHPDISYSLENLGNLYSIQGKHELAEPLYKRALSIREQQFGEMHPHTAGSLNNLGNLYRNLGKLELAEPLQQRALSIWEQQLGPQHAYTAYALHGLGDVYYDQGKYEQAESCYRRALSIREQALVPTHPELLETVHQLALLRQTQGHYDEAQSLYERALDGRSGTLGPTHPHTIDTHTRLVALLRDMGLSEEAETLCSSFSSKSFPEL